jgi:hypothetical protein
MLYKLSVLEDYAASEAGVEETDSQDSTGIDEARSLLVARC